MIIVPQFGLFVNPFLKLFLPEGWGGVAPSPWGKAGSLSQLEVSLALVLNSHNLTRQGQLANNRAHSLIGQVR